MMHPDILPTTVSIIRTSGKVRIPDGFAAYLRNPTGEIIATLYPGQVIKIKHRDSLLMVTENQIIVNFNLFSPKIRKDRGQFYKEENVLRLYVTVENPVKYAAEIESHKKLTDARDLMNTALSTEYLSDFNDAVSSLPFGEYSFKELSAIGVMWPIFDNLNRLGILLNDGELKKSIVPIDEETLFIDGFSVENIESNNIGTMLTMKNLHCSEIAFTGTDPLVIALEGENSCSSIVSRGDIKIIGNGKLQINSDCDNIGIESKNLIIDGNVTISIQTNNFAISSNECFAVNGSADINLHSRAEVACMAEKVDISSVATVVFEGKEQGVSCAYEKLHKGTVVRAGDKPESAILQSHLVVAPFLLVTGGVA